MKRVVKRTESLLAPGGHFLLGDVACAEGALAAGCRFYAGYPITPSTEIMSHMAQRLSKVGGVFIQMEDELGSISAVIGAAWAGAKAMTATSGPGLSLMLEGIGYAIITETPCVIVDVQRAGPSTGQATRPAQGDVMQVKWGAHGDHEIIALAPWSVQEMYDLTIRAFNLSERFRVPAFIVADESVGHLRERIEVSHHVDILDRVKAAGQPPFGVVDDISGVPAMPSFGEGQNLLVTGSTHDRWGFRKTSDPKAQALLTERLSCKIIAHTDEISETNGYYIEDAEELMVAYGFTARATLGAVKILRRKKKKIGLLRLKTLWPFPSRELKSIAEGIKHIYVPEMNRGQIAAEIQKHIHPEVIPIVKTDGEVFYPKDILEGMEKG